MGHHVCNRNRSARTFGCLAVADCHTARFTAWPDEGVGIITVQGELDASMQRFADHVEQCADDGVG